MPLLGGRRILLQSPAGANVGQPEPAGPNPPNGEMGRPAILTSPRGVRGEPGIANVDVDPLGRELVKGSLVLPDSPADFGSIRSMRKQSHRPGHARMQALAEIQSAVTQERRDIFVTTNRTGEGAQSRQPGSIHLDSYVQSESSDGIPSLMPILEFRSPKNPVGVSYRGLRSIGDGVAIMPQDLSAVALDALEFTAPSIQPAVLQLTASGASFLGPPMFFDIGEVEVIGPVKPGTKLPGPNGPVPVPPSSPGAWFEVYQFVHKDAITLIQHITGAVTVYCDDDNRELGSYAVDQWEFFEMPNGGTVNDQHSVEGQLILSQLFAAARAENGQPSKRLFNMINKCYRIEFDLKLELTEGTVTKNKDAEVNDIPGVQGGKFGFGGPDGSSKRSWSMPKKDGTGSVAHDETGGKKGHGIKPKEGAAIKTMKHDGGVVYCQADGSPCEDKQDKPPTTSGYK